MNAIDIMERAQNGEQIVPQFSPPSGLFAQNIKNGEIQQFDKQDNDDFLQKKNGTNYAFSKNEWKQIANEDLPQFADKKTQNMTMLYNALEALKNRNFQKKMYGERYQKIIQDIKKAGLNPYAINFFSPGGIQSGSAASIMSNYQASNSNVRSESKSRIKSSSKNENWNHSLDERKGWMNALSSLGIFLGSIFRLLI